MLTGEITQAFFKINEKSNRNKIKTKIMKLNLQLNKCEMIKLKKIIKKEKEKANPGKSLKYATISQICNI